MTFVLIAACQHQLFLALSLLKKEKMNNFVWAATSGEKRCLEYLALHKHFSAVLKICANVDTTVENAYTVIYQDIFKTSHSSAIYVPQLFFCSHWRRESHAIYSTSSFFLFTLRTLTRSPLKLPTCLPLWTSLTLMSQKHLAFWPRSLLPRPWALTGSVHLYLKLVLMADALFVPIHHLFTVSLSNGLTHSEWCTHLITLIFKSGDKSLISNYRPISLLCSVSKVLERIVFSSVYNFIADSIFTSQFGFMRGRSSQQQLLIMLN